MGEENKDNKVNLSYVEWLEQVVAEYQPDWICDELVCYDEWCHNNCKDNWNGECLKRYYSKHFDTADTPQTDLLVKSPRKSRESHEIDTPQTDCAWK